MTRIPGVVAAVFAFCTLVQADEVKLKSGAVIEGQILSETQHEVQVMVARNRAGTIKTLKIINREEVSSMSRGAATVRFVDEPTGPRASTPETPTGEDEEEMNLEKVEDYLEQSDGLLSQGKYDEAITRFNTVASSEKLENLAETGVTDEAAEALDLRIRAYKLWAIALEGKAEHQEEAQDNAKEQIEDKLRDAKQKLRDRERDEERNDRDRSNRRIEMRSRQYAPGATTPIEDFEQELLYWEAQQDKFTEWASRNELDILNMESEIELIEEKVDQLEDDQSDLLKVLRKR